MLCEAVVVLGREAHHFRVTRAFRPFFLVDTILLQDVRRCISCMLRTLYVRAHTGTDDGTRGQGARVHASYLQKCGYVVLHTKLMYVIVKGW